MGKNRREGFRIPEDALKMSKLTFKRFKKKNEDYYDKKKELKKAYYDKLLDSFRDVAEKDAEEHFYETTDLDDFDPQYDF